MPLKCLCTIFVFIFSPESTAHPKKVCEKILRFAQNPIFSFYNFFNIYFLRSTQAAYKEGRRALITRHVTLRAVDSGT